MESKEAVFSSYLKGFREWDRLSSNAFLRSLSPSLSLALIHHLISPSTNPPCHYTIAFSVCLRAQRQMRANYTLALTHVRAHAQTHMQTLVHTCTQKHTQTQACKQENQMMTKNTHTQTNTHRDYIFQVPPACSERVTCVKSGRRRVSPTSNITYHKKHGRH